MYVGINVSVAVYRYLCVCWRVCRCGSVVCKHICVHWRVCVVVAVCKHLCKLACMSLWQCTYVCVRWRECLCGIVLVSVCTLACMSLWQCASISVCIGMYAFVAVCKYLCVRWCVKLSKVKLDITPVKTALEGDGVFSGVCWR